MVQTPVNRYRNRRLCLSIDCRIWLSRIIVPIPPAAVKSSLVDSYLTSEGAQEYFDHLILAIVFTPILKSSFKCSDSRTSEICLLSFVEFNYFLEIKSKIRVCGFVKN